MSRVGRCCVVRCLSAGGCVAPSTPRIAGAWTLPEGHGQVVVTGTASTADRGLRLRAATSQPTPRYSKFELQALIEYGVTDWLTAIVAPGLQHVDIAAPVDAQRTGLGYSEFGGARPRHARRRTGCCRPGHLRVPGTFDTGNPAAIGYNGFEVDLRALFGYSFALGGLAGLHRSAARAALPHRRPAERGARRSHASALRAAPQWLLLVQSSTWSRKAPAARRFPSNDYHKLQLSVVYDLTPQWSLQGGGFTTFAAATRCRRTGSCSACGTGS